MGFMDKAKDMAMKAGNKANDVAEDLAQRAGPMARDLKHRAVPYAEKASDMATKGMHAAAANVNKATGGKYQDKIERISGNVDDALGRFGNLMKNGQPDQPEANPDTNK